MDGEIAADRARVIIVGGGLAGLTCAKVLAREGRGFILLEASGQVGGRVVSRRTDEGFILDRGFQVLLDSYSSARRHLDLKALGGGYFRPGAMFVGNGAPRAVENPLHRVGSIFSSLATPDIPFADKCRLVSLVVSALAAGGTGSLRRMASVSDESASRLLQRKGFSEEFFVNFARPFFGGVLLDPDLQTSASLLLGYLRHFALGRALMPGEGIGEIGRQLASHLPAGSVCLHAPVVKLTPGTGVVLRDGREVLGRAVVLAVEEPELCRLLGKGSPRPARRTAVHYFALRRKWYEGAWLCLPPRRSQSPVLHASLVSNAAPSLAPPGQHLCSVTVIPGHPSANDPEFIAREVAGWFGADAREARHLDYVEVPYAVPEQPAGFARHQAPWAPLAEGIAVAGDAVVPASIDAAMASGEAVARNLIASQSGCCL